MDKLSANLSLLFTELPFLQRFEAAARAGFTAVEFWFPYDHPAEEVGRALAATGLECVVINTPPGLTDRGDWGLGIFRQRRAEFRAGLELALHYAEVLRCRKLHVMAGIVPPAASGHERCRADEFEQTYVGNLRDACAKARQQGLQLLVEPLNCVDRPGYYVPTLAKALELVREVGEPNLAVMLDLYHAQMQEGNLCAKLQQCGRHLGHVQVADVPGRHEPGSGEINWPFVMAELRATGYSGWVGLEYRPLVATDDSLACRRLLAPGPSPSSSPL